MKKLLYFFSVLALSLAFVSCDDDDDDKGRLEPNAMISIRPDASFQLKAVHAGLTPEEIVRDAYSLNFRTHYLDNEYFEEVHTPNRGTPEFMKDYENNIIKFWASDIIGGEGSFLEGQLKNDFLKGFDLFIMNEADDTIAYVPNEVLRAAEPLIEAAYEAENYTEVYRLFDEAFTYKAIEVEEQGF